MKTKVENRMNKMILIVLVILMVLPFSIDILGISMSKISTILLILIFCYMIFRKKNDVLLILKNKFVLFNIAFSISIALSILSNYKTMLFNDLYEILKYIIFAICTVIIISVCKDKSNYMFLLKVISITLIAISIFGIIQYFNPFSINELYIKSYAPTQYKTLTNDYPSPRIVGTKANPSVYGMLMSIGVYFNLLYCKSSKNKNEKILAIVSIALCVINLMLTLTRTIQIAFMVSIIIYIFANVWIEKGFKKALIAMLCAILLLAIILCLLPESLTWRLVQVLDISNTTSWVARTEKWSEYVELIKQNLLLGIGPVKNYVADIGYVDSELIQVVLQYGILGIIVYIIMLLSPIYVYLKNKRYKNIISFYPSILAIIIINNISNTSLILFDTAIGIYMLIALLFIEAEPKEENNKLKNENQE